MGCRSALVTFNPDPAAILAPGRPMYYLTSTAEKVALLSELCLDLLVVLTFDLEMARTTAQDFVARLRRHLNMRQLWVGPDFALGYKRQGDIPTLQALGQQMGFEVRFIPPISWSGEIVSSTRIRELLLEGRVREAANLLGRYPHLPGRVVIGAKRGRILGFPTANLTVDNGRLIPANGVYAIYAWMDGQRSPGVANIGVRPTFAGEERTIEAHLLDLERELYDLTLAIEFVERLRPEQRFASIRELQEQVGRDMAEAREILAAEDPPAYPTSHLVASALD
jgi:riboflavin kinase/FMN adenylyltransferase